MAVLAWATLAACAPGDEGGSDAVRSAPPEVSTDGRNASDAEEQRRRIVFLGTSLTAGYGLADPERAYPARIQARIDSAGLPFEVVNAGVSGDTSAGGLARLDWLLRSPVDVLFLELGANDGLRGQDPSALQGNLLEIVRRVRETNPDAAIVVAGMEAPPNLGPDYTSRFRAVFPAVAQAADAALMPFLLDGVAGESSLNQPDGIHPTAEGHGRIASRVWEVLAPVLEDQVAG